MVRGIERDMEVLLVVDGWAREASLEVCLFYSSFRGQLFVLLIHSP